ncbi:MAG TPA: c-type cytochrome domain-containing protein [Candidatus Acidoferrum sp.]|nr:c-type cytochrome domain-containing protein [Candidatus Acidoferrum sp.]
MCAPSAAAQIEETNLPPVAAVTIDFTRDIKPILNNSCLRCHTGQKPRSGFRLENRADALKGGDNGVDIVPGHSAQSHLIHYVARLVPDLEMPPPGKGEPLSPAQIGLLRAWIDQGAAWEAGQPADQFTYSFSPLIGGTAVSGDAQKFRELYWEKNGLNGGLAQFDLAGHPAPDTRFSFSGHALADDYKLDMSLRKNGLGFIDSGWEQYRKYFDGTGGYDPFLSRSVPTLGQGLHLDIGRAWVDVGLTLPNWPQMTLGFEQDYKVGAEATTDWNGTPGSDLRNLAPASKQIHEEVNIIKFDLDHELAGITVEERFRGEFYNLNSHYTNLDARDAAVENAREGNSYFQGANTLRLERKFTDWLFGSAGYLYSQLNADASFSDAANHNLALMDLVPQITLQRESHVFNLNGLLGPFDGLTLSSGVEGEWTREHGLGGNDAMLNPIFTNGSAPPPALSPVVLSMLNSSYDESSLTESTGLRYGKIPFTVLFADARLQQQSIGQSDYDLQKAADFIENIAFSSQLSDLRAGFNTSPWPSISFSAHYRRYENASQYQDERIGPLPVGYPGFIRERDLLTDETEARLVLRPWPWLKTTWSYQYLTTGYSTVADASPKGVSPGGAIVAGQYKSQIYALNTTLTPCPRLYLSTTFSYQPTTSISAANGVPTVVPYRGDIYSLMANATYALGRNSDLFADYSFSEANYAQNDFAATVPLGLQYRQHAVGVGLERRLGKNVTAKIQYGYYHYAEPSSGGADNFTGNSIFATLTFRGP